MVKKDILVLNLEEKGIYAFKEVKINHSMNSKVNQALKCKNVELAVDDKKCAYIVKKHNFCNNYNDVFKQINGEFYEIVEEVDYTTVEDKFQVPLALISKHKNSLSKNFEKVGFTPTEKLFLKLINKTKTEVENYFEQMNNLI